MDRIHAQEVEYSHPLHAFSFEASPFWDQELHNYNGKVFQVTNPNHNMSISLSFIPGRKNARRHMKQVSDQNGLICRQKPYDTILNRKKAVVMQGFCLQGKEPYSRLIIGIPGDEGLYLMEITCPSDCYINHRSKVNAILGSLKIDA
jgi:hypothetical protein